MNAPVGATDNLLSTEIVVVAGTNWGGLSVIRSLGRHGLYIVAMASSGSEYGITSRYVNERVICPHPRDEEAYINFLLDKQKAWSGALILPTTDHDVTTLSKHKRLLENHYRLAVSDWHITKLFIDKSYTYALANEIGVPAPKTLNPKSVEEVENYGRNVLYPCLIKPNQVHLFQQQFNTKMFPVSDFDELIAKYQEAAAAGIDVMIQEFIPGDDSANVNYNSYFWPDLDPVEFTARKVRNAPPRYGSPRIVVSQHIPEIIEPGRKILKQLGYCGFSCMEFKEDRRDGTYKLMEVNGRHNRSGALAIRCGIDFPWIDYANRILGESPSPATFEEGVYWVDLMSDIKHSVKYYRVERYSIQKYLQPYVRPHIFDVLNFRDIKPFIKRVFARFSKFLPFVP